MAGQPRAHGRKTFLRAPAKPLSVIHSPAPAPKEIVTSRRRKEDKMHALALELGF